ncbi:PD-(D/E)XK nuclease family protein [Arcanobacterium hippocoleae]
MKNPEQYLRNQMRPIPVRPLAAARRGTIVHAQIANFFEYPQHFNIDEITDSEEMKIDAGLMQNDAQVKQLYQRFEESRFAALKPIAIEQSLELTIADKPVRCVVDAVFDTAKITGARPITIVDWKTSRRPTDTDIESRRFQLALYRHAWAHSTGTPIECIDACFYYLGEKIRKNANCTSNRSALN